MAAVREDGPGGIAPRFSDALSKLSEAHDEELFGVREAYDSKLDQLNKENEALRARLSQMGISPEDVSVPLVDDQAAGAAGQEDCKLARFAKRESSKSAYSDFEIKIAWNRNLDTTQWGSTNLDLLMSKYGGKKASSMRQSGVLLNGDEVQGDPNDCNPLRGKFAFVIFPNSSFRLAWDLSGLVLIFYDLITIPFNQAFAPAPSWFGMTMDWVTLLFWTGDMSQGFFLGYFDKGQYVSDHRKILKHYFTSWFVPDIIVVAPEWLMIFASSLLMPAGNDDNQDVTEMGKIMKGARAIRVLRLLRLLKLQRIINMLYDMIESEHTFICVNLTKLLMSVLVLNHVIACIWYLIGRLAMENQVRNWIEIGAVEDSDISYKYTTSLHWSLTQFTPASMDISARNVWERAFSIVVLFFAMVAFSSIVGSITGSMTSLRNMKNEEMKQFWLLRRYLRQRNISKRLSEQIFNFLEYQSQKQSKLVQVGNIKVISQLSESLHNELMYEMHCRTVTEHPFFGTLDSDMHVVMTRLCRFSLTPQSYAEKEVIFHFGEEGKKMYFFKNGEVDYATSDANGTGGPVKLSPPLKPNEWIAEAVLWINIWRHQGDLSTTCTSDIIGVIPSQFVDVMSIHPKPWFYAKCYAIKFVDFLNEKTEKETEINDILRDPEWYKDAVHESFAAEKRESASGWENSFALNSWTMPEGQLRKAAAYAAAYSDEDEVDGANPPSQCGEEPSLDGFAHQEQDSTADKTVRRRGLGFCSWGLACQAGPWCGGVSVNPDRIGAPVHIN